MNGTLFSNDDMSTFLGGHEDLMRQEIQAGYWDNIIQQEPENAIERLRDKYTLEQIKINWEKKDPKRTIHNDVMEVSFYITFTGDSSLLRYKPSQYRVESVPGTVYEQNRIAMKITGQLGMDDFKRELDRWRESLEFHLHNANADADKFNRALPTKIKSMLDVRTEQIRKADDEMVSMGFPEGES